MIDIAKLREQPDEFKQNLIGRQKADRVVFVDELLRLDAKRRELIQEVEQLKAQRNSLSSQIKGGDDRLLIQQAADVKGKIQLIDPALEKIEQEIQILIRKLPNWKHPDVPLGKDERENVILRTWNEPTKFNFEPHDHVDIGSALDLIDIETAAMVSGSRFNYLKNEAVLMQMGLIQFVFEKLGDRAVIGELAEKVGNSSDKPFTPILPPVIFKAEVAKKMDRFDPIEDRYYLEQDDQLLVGSAEHTLGPMLMDRILDEGDLPIRLIGYSTAFRREAGSYGKDTRGILRRHQFDKLEMESFTTSESGEREQDLIVAIQEYLVQQLKIPHQVMAICSGDMGGPDYRQIDINCWMPGQNSYRETQTSDYMTDFQARRLNTRYRKKDGQVEFVHMNDATALAMGRILIAILENYQQSDGSVVVPDVLTKYVGKELIKR